MKAAGLYYNEANLEDRKFFTTRRITKLIFLPLLCLTLPNITGLVTNSLYSFPLLLIIYSFFILTGIIVWQGNERIMAGLKNKFRASDKDYFKKFIQLLIAVVVYTVCSSTILTLCWQYFSKEEPDSARLLNTVALITMFAVFITNMYENYFLKEENSNTLTMVENLNIAKTHAELIALKNQIDPHFIFNSLNTLSYLITSDPVNAKLYNDTLAKVYQYILTNREKSLVQLAEEIEFMTNYFYLLKIRFGKSINMIIEINDAETAEFLILPISLQILLENVMKHNELIAGSPLLINITVGSTYVQVQNKVNAKKFAAGTSKVGLTNLANRYKLLTGRNIITEQSAETFLVKLPLINLNL